MRLFPKRASFKYFKGKGSVILVIVAVSFYLLHNYRNNDPIPISSKAPDIELTTIDNVTFQMGDIRKPKVLIFFNDYAAFANNIYPFVYKQRIPKLVFMQDDGVAEIIIIVKNAESIQDMKKITEKYPFMEDLIYMTKNNTEIALQYGVRSWPHVFILDSNNRVKDHMKFLSFEKIHREFYKY